MVHQYQLNNYNIVLDTCSGAIHSVDDVAYDIISMYGQAGGRQKMPLSGEDRRSISGRILEKYGHRPDVTERDINKCVAYAISILTSIAYNDNVIENYLGDDIFLSSEEAYDIFEHKKDHVIKFAIKPQNI